MQKQETFEVNGLEVTVGINSDGRGWFESYDLESGGVDYYVEGGLWFDGMELTDYDGVYDLPTAVKDRLIEWGYQVD